MRHVVAAAWLAVMLTALLLGPTLVACAPVQMVTACATDGAGPPIVVEPQRCPGVGFRSYTVPASQLDADDQPVLGQPLDDDFWEYDNAGHRRSRSTLTTTTTSPKVTTTTKAKASTKANRPTTTRRTK